MRGHVRAVVLNLRGAVLCLGLGNSLPPPPFTDNWRRMLGQISGDQESRLIRELLRLTLPLKSARIKSLGVPVGKPCSKFLETAFLGLPF
jgi:hypothetical protein